MTALYMNLNICMFLLILLCIFSHLHDLDLKMYHEVGKEASCFNLVSVCSVNNPTLCVDIFEECY